MTNQSVTASDTLDISNVVTSRLTPMPHMVLSALKPNEIYDPSWSPDGKQIIFAEHIRGTYKVTTYLLDVATPHKVEIYTGLLRTADPTFSTDGFRILFAEQTVPVSGSFPYGKWRIRYMNADGTNVVTILDDGNANLHPCWVTPTQVAFQWWSYGATPSTAFHIAMVDLAGNGRIEMGEGEYPRLVVI